MVSVQYRLKVSVDMIQNLDIDIPPIIKRKLKFNLGYNPPIVVRYNVPLRHTLR